MLHPTYPNERIQFCLLCGMIHARLLLQSYTTDYTVHTWMIANNSNNNENYRKYQRNEFVAFRNTAQIQRIEIGEEKFCEMAIRRQCVILN